MKTRPGAMLAFCASAFLSGLFQSPTAAQGASAEALRIAQGAASPSASSGAANGSQAAASGRYGTAANGMPFDREVRLGANTKSVGVWRFETINFVSAEGREFRWRFDTTRELDVFPLERIAPSDISIPGGARVYVNGEIPIAP